MRAASLPSLIAHTTSEAPLTISPAAKTPSKLVCIDFKSIFKCTPLRNTNSLALNNFGKFSGSNPKDLITRSAGILYSDPYSISGLLLPDESGSPNFILFTSTASYFILFQ